MVAKRLAVLPEDLDSASSTDRVAHSPLQRLGNLMPSYGLTGTHVVPTYKSRQNNNVHEVKINL